MRAVLLNRIITFLAFAGIADAGFLSLAKVMNINIPCGGSRACDVVTNSDYSKFAGIPVAYLGLLAYLTILVLAIASRFRGLDRSKPLIYAGYGVSGVGMLISFGLQYVSINELRFVCWLCLTSAAIMLLLFITHAVLAQMEPQPKSAGATDIGFVAALALVCLLGVGGAAVSVKGKALKTGIYGAELPYDKKTLIPANPNIIGNPQAKLIIIEFGDLLCPACQKDYLQLKGLATANQDKMAYIFRHFPLIKNPSHRASLPAAMRAEYAASKGKFWEFMDASYALDVSTIHSMEEHDNILLNLGLDPREAESTVADQSSVPFNRVYDDLNTGLKLGIHLTPTFFVFVNSNTAKPYSDEGLWDLLQQPEVKSLLR